MASDARVRYTKMVIAQSFIKLLKEKPINKITVKAICDLSDPESISMDTVSAR